MNSCSECLYFNCGKDIDVFINDSCVHGFCDEHYSEGLSTSLINCSFCHSSQNISADFYLNRKEEFYSKHPQLTPPHFAKDSDCYSIKPMSSGLPSTPDLKNKTNTLWRTHSASRINMNQLMKMPTALQSKRPSDDKKSRNMGEVSSILINCSEINCTSKKATKLCNNHAFCEMHTKKLNNNMLCPLCKCSKCKSYGMYYFRDCQQKYCPNPACKDTIKCCFVCCQKGQTEMNACKHFLCEIHKKEGFDCPCKRCIYCNSTPVKTRSCLHLVCTDCEYEGSCRKCLEGSCEFCGNIGLLKTGDCIHKRCENCKDKVCSKCQPICTHCNKNKSSLRTSCKTHPKCEECEELFSKLSCVYCRDLDEFTCSRCNNIVPMLSKYSCQHKYCSLCNENLECSHTTMCKFCVDNFKFCSECHPNWICRQCNNYELNNNFTCRHNFCKNCGIAKGCGHFKCNKCKQEEFMYDDECLSCAGSICNFCNKIDLISTSDCRHKICRKCKNSKIFCTECFPLKHCLFCNENFQYEPICKQHPYCSACNTIAKNDSCIVCTNTLNEFQCSYCLRIYDKLNPIKCGHSACNGCLIMNRDACEICKDYKCSFCLSEEKLITRRCIHPLCENCQGIIKDQPCPKCARTEQNFLCQGCKSFANLLQLKGCQHKICLNCNDNSIEVCIICSNKCSYCKKSKEKLIINLDCKHHFCIDCFNGFIQKYPSCIFCANIETDYTCNNCKCVLDGLYKLHCGHSLCVCCYSDKCGDCIEGVCMTCGENKILKANECQHLLCDKCLDEKNCRMCDTSMYCKSCKSFVLKDHEMCQHQFCDLCRTKQICIECLCQACQKINFKHKFDCGHRVCDDCAGEGICLICKFQCCELCNKNRILYDKGCGHYLCEECQSLNKCYVCEPRKFCICCKEDRINSRLCDHRICNSCRIKHKCLECKCSRCNKDKNLEKKPCGHLMCYYCRSTYQKRPCSKDLCKICKRFNAEKVINPCNHILCIGCNALKKCGLCFPELLCKVCEMYKLEVFCEHGACFLCRDKCMCSLACQKCKKQYQKLSQMNCGHQVCYKCSKSQLCTDCFKSKCDFCKKYNNMMTQHNCGRHILCKDCFDIQICYACNPHYYCSGCRRFEIIPHRKHEFCNSCIIKKKCPCYCEKCYGTKIQNLLECGHYSCACPISTCIECKLSACLLCKVTDVLKTYRLTCNLKLCYACLDKHNCLNSKCQQCSEVCQALCPHKLCNSCVNIHKCPCFCNNCNSPGINIRTCLYQHSLCDNCSKDSKCPVCHDEHFELISQPINEPMQDSLVKDEIPLRIPILPDLVPSLCIKCNYMETPEPSQKCTHCQKCCNFERLKVVEVNFELEYQCCMKTFCKKCSYMISNSLGKRGLHLCKN